MTDQTLSREPTKVKYDNTLRDLTFRAAFNKTLRARLGRCPSQREQSEPGLGDLSKPTALFKSKFRSILGYFTLVFHLNNVWLMILQGTLVYHIESVI